MKYIESNPANVSIAVVYCFFGILSFFVLKIAAKYFMKDQASDTKKKSQAIHKKISRAYLVGVNFSKVFFQTYFFKNTLIGSILNADKKYLLKQIFIMTCIAISCFNINRYVIWPWTIGLATSLITCFVSQMIIPYFLGPKKQIQVVDQSQVVSNINEPSIMGSIQIQINTKHELILSAQGEQSVSKKDLQKSKSDSAQKPPNLELFFIVFLIFVSEILVCACILKLTLSVSNSGVLNLISLGIAITIDQIAVRTGLGLTTYLVCLIVHKTKIINLLENRIFYSCCSEAILKDLKRVHQQATIEVKENKVSNQNNQPQILLTNTENKMIQDNIFSYEQKVEDQIKMSEEDRPQSNVVLQEQDFDQAESQPQGQTLLQSLNQPNEAKLSQVIPKDQTNYFELYEHDIETFTEQIITTTERQNEKIKKIKKRAQKPEEKVKSDPLLYLPFEQHKQSIHRNSIKQDLKSFQNQISLFEKQKTSIAENFLQKIEVLECVNDSIVTEEEEMIGTILHEKNLNIKNLTINEKAQIPPTARPGHSATKRSISKDSIGLKKVKKVSPYLVDLQSQAVRPSKSNKNKKLLVSKINKENSNQTNSTMMLGQTIEASRMNTKEVQTRNNWMSNEKKMLGR